MVMRKNTHFNKEPNAQCSYCGRGFFRYPAELRRYKRVFCSNPCQGKWNKENLYNKPNTICAYCGKVFHKTPSRKRGYSLHFCNNTCQGKYWAKHFTGENTSNWQGGKTELRINEIQRSSYRTWRKHLLKNVECILCGSKRALELHHIELRSENPLRIRDESNVVPMCEECHDLFHSNSRKGGELRESLKTILGYGNSQPSLRNEEGSETNANCDTSTAPERDDIVRATEKSVEARLKSQAITKLNRCQ